MLNFKKWSIKLCFNVLCKTGYIQPLMTSIQDVLHYNPREENSIQHLTNWKVLRLSDVQYSILFLQVPTDQDSHETASTTADQAVLNQTASKEEPNNLNVFNKQTNNSSGQFSLLSAFGGQSKETNSSAGQFSLLSEFGQSKETESNVPEVTETEILSDAFALKLKEKASNEASAKSLIEPFFFGQKMEDLLKLINFCN